MTAPSGATAASATCWSTPWAGRQGPGDAADVGDRDGAAQLLKRLDRRRFPRLRHGWVDGGYRGPFLDWTQQRRGIAFQVVSRSDGGRKPRWLPPGATPPIVSSFALVPRRWW